MKILFISLGCDKNLVDTEVMLGLLASRGYEMTDDETQADIIVINTCCFIHDAKEESIQNILEMAEYKKEGKAKALIVTGCLAERYRQEILDEIPEVDEVLGQGNGSVYVYYYDVYREIAEIKEERFWPCKIGMSDKDGMDRIFSQAGTAYPEAPHIALMIKCNSPRDVENALHAILKVRGQWIADAPGTEWFLTSPDDVKHIYYALVQTQNENL